MTDRQRPSSGDGGGSRPDGRDARLAALFEASDILATPNDGGALLDALAGCLRRALGAAVARVYEFDADERLLTLVAHDAAAEADPDRWQGTIDVEDDGFLAQRLAARVATRVGAGDAGADPGLRKAMRARGEGTAVLAPMVYQGEVVGLLWAAHAAATPGPDAVDLRLASAVGALGAAAIVTTRLRLAFDRQTTSDPLTGLLSRRYFMERLEEAVARGGRYSMGFSLLMIDVDDFREFNETHGREEGDRLLRTLADLLRAGTRDKADLVARFGGEEFVALLPHTLEDGALTTAGRLRESLVREAAATAEQLRVAAATRAREGSPGEAAASTISVGIACFPEHGSTVIDVLGSADKALYLAKKLGKDRVCVYEP